MRFGLKENTIEQINSVFEEFPQVEEVRIYGSRAIGNFRNGSDIDLTIKGTGLSHELLNSIRTRLDDLSLLYIFDVSEFKKIDNQDLVKHINRVGKIFYKNRMKKVEE